MSFHSLIQNDADGQELRLVVVDDTGTLFPQYGQARVSLAHFRQQQALNGSALGLQGVRLQAVHTILANAPVLASVLASSPLLNQRLFIGSGAPTSSTLAAGNGMYCATTGGFVVEASLLTTGAGYTAGQVLTVTGGTGPALAITVDTVGSSGQINTYHVSLVGIYTVYPANPVSVAGGASFNFAVQPADAYLDISTPTAPKLYVCTTPGTNATSAWSLISGGGAGTGFNFRGVWLATNTYAANDAVFLGTGTASGMYYSLTNANTNAPDSGIGWAIISSYSTWL